MWYGRCISCMVTASLLVRSGARSHFTVNQMYLIATNFRCVIFFGQNAMFPVV